MPKFPEIHVLKLDHVPIYQQLQIEEALLRADDRNWCVINSGSTPAIVMGISGKPELLIDSEKLDPAVPIIRRFSGGGTVVVDSNTYFISFICNSECSGINCFPNDVHCWAKELYRSIFEGLNFDLRENDYVIEDRKFGGNAQYLRKGRWLHHSTLLWDFDPKRMEYLLLPQKRPKYREDRNHSEFLCRLCDYMEDKKTIQERLYETLETKFIVVEPSEHILLQPLQTPHRKATEIL